MKWEPLYWVGEHAVILEDVTEYGLVRRHIVRRDAWPDVEQFMASAPERAEHRLYQDDDGFCHLWIWWKDPSKATKVTKWMTGEHDEFL